MTDDPHAADQDAYVLGTDLDELERLGLQHELWSAVAHRAWEHAGIRLGMHVVDIGCGPGFASFDLARLVGRTGRIVGADLSERFVASVNARAAREGLPQVEAHVCEADAIASGLGLEPGSVDAAYTRWLLCFVADPEAVVAAAASLLRPGGRLVVHDYFNYTSMTTAPRRPAFARVIEATNAAWRQRGGNPDVMELVPEFAVRHGFEIERFEVHQRLARPGTQMWDWPVTFWRNFNQVLLEMNLITEADDRAFQDTMEELAQIESAYIVLPPVFELIARKR